MRILIALCILLALRPSANPSPRTASQGEGVGPEDEAIHQQLKASLSEGGADKDQRHEGEPTPHAEPVSTLKADNAEQEASNKVDKFQEEPQGWLKWYVIGTWVIAIFSGLTAWAAYRQSKSAETAANAAKASADALINSERAWVMAEIAWTADVPDVPRPTKLRLIEGFGTEGETLAADVCLICKNDGRSPAWITEEILWFTVLHEAPPEKPDTTTPRSFSYSGPEPLSVKEFSKIPMTLVYKGSRPQVGEGAALVIYGVVKYRDAFGDHETWCGYTINGATPRLQRLAGYPEYNKNT